MTNAISLNGKVMSNVTFQDVPVGGCFWYRERQSDENIYMRIGISTVPNCAVLLKNGLVYTIITTTEVVRIPLDAVINLKQLV